MPGAFAIKPIGGFEQGEELQTVLYSSRTMREFDYLGMRSGACSCPDPNCYGAFRTPQGSFLSPHALVRPVKSSDIAEQSATTFLGYEYGTGFAIQYTSNSFHFRYGSHSAAKNSFAPLKDVFHQHEGLEDLNRSEERGKC